MDMEQAQAMGLARDYRTAVLREECELDVVPRAVTFTIDPGTASRIYNLAGLAAAEGIDYLVIYDDRAVYLQYDPLVEPEEADSVGTANVVRTEGDHFCVSPTEFWFAGSIRNTSVEVCSERLPLDDLATHFGMERRAPQVFSGYLAYEGVRIDVDFEVPGWASVAERDAAFLATLAQQVEINYVAIGGKTHD